jgi:hypothetical protein
VRNGMLIMLVEFILVHASGFLGGQIFAERISRSRRFLILAGFSVFYLIFVATFALSFDQWWPYIAFGWLMLGKFASVLARNLPSGERLKQLETEWGIGAVVYILGVFVTVILPMPAFGITPDVIRNLDLPGGGMWVDEPQRVIAFGVLYFSLIGLYKAKR